MIKNTNESTKDSSTNLNFTPKKKKYNSEDVVHGIVGHPNGNFYKVGGKDISSVYLSLIEGNQLNTCPMAMLLQNVNNGTWLFYAKGDDSWKAKVYTDEVLEYKNNVLKALIYNQLCTEANDVLIETVEHDKYLTNLLKKANKGLERKSIKHLEGVYGADPQMLTNVFKAIDTFVCKMAKTLPHEFFYLNSIVDEYSEDPTKYIGRKIELYSTEKNDGERY